MTTPAPHSVLLGLLAETSLHVGSGRLIGAIDLPFVREAATGLPFVPGSGFKGSLRDAWRQRQSDERRENALFGEATIAGGVLVGDARLLLLPVRSLTGRYRWLTSPLLLERLERDARRAGMPIDLDIPAMKSDQYVALGEGTGALYLEERTFQVTGRVPASVLSALGQLIRHESTRSRLAQQVVIVGDDDFKWFAESALDVHARNVLDENKTSKNLWYEETVPPDALFYAMIADRRDGSAVQELLTMFADRPYLQVGGNETVGQGWVAVRPWGQA